jgi:organic hydroperoxide reductase OsmC/OhrA
MQSLPHLYTVQASGGSAGAVSVSAPGLPTLATQAPPQFGGPEGHWSPETLLAAAVADCYILSFRAVARASQLAWRKLDVSVEAVLDRIDGVTRFTHFKVKPVLCIDSDDTEAVAQTVLAKAKRACLVSNSMMATTELEPTILAGEAACQP